MFDMKSSLGEGKVASEQGLSTTFEAPSAGLEARCGYDLAPQLSKRSGCAQTGPMSKSPDVETHNTVNYETNLPWAEALGKSSSMNV